MTHPTRRRPVATAEYHRLDFSERDEASAFMAALSRFITSPAGTSVVAEGEPVEVWTSMQENGDRLYLNNSAKRATVAAFSPVPELTPIRGSAIPRNVLLSLAGFTARPMGFDEAKAERS